MTRPDAVRDAGRLGVADRGRRAGLGHRDDQVGLDRVLAGQPAADLDPGRVHAAPADRGVRPGQVDVLEQAALGLGGGEVLRAQAVLVDRDQLARLDLADEGGADDVERGGLGRDDPAAVEPAEHERADALRVAGGVERVLVHEDQRERAAQLGQHLHRGLLDDDVRARGEQRGEQVGVGGGADRSACGCRPRRASSASSAVLTRLPLWPSARPVPVGVVRKLGWAFSQVVEPVVE